MLENEISYNIRRCVFTVYNALGPGLLESAYEAALHYEIAKMGLNIQSQVSMPMIYEDTKVNVGYRLDFVVERKVILNLNQ